MGETIIIVIIILTIWSFVLVGIIRGSVGTKQLMEKLDQVETNQKAILEELQKS